MLFAVSLVVGGAVWSPFGAKSVAAGSLLGAGGAAAIGMALLKDVEGHARIYVRFPVGRAARANAREIVRVMGWAALLIAGLAFVDGARLLASG